MNSHGPLTPNELYALVSYVPDPLGSFLDALRHTLAGHNASPAHLTFLPPRPLGVDPDAASAIIRAKLRSFVAFDVELAGVRCFPLTNVLYLGLSEGNLEAQKLHDSLHSDAGLHHVEEFEYRPHITLSTPVDTSEIEQARRVASLAWSRWTLSRRFTIRDVAFLRRSSREVWERLWIEPLAVPRHGSAPHSNSSICF
jgi:2'-5' RNA ligase